MMRSPQRFARGLRKKQKTRLPLRRVLLLAGMGLMIPCYLFTVLNVLLSPWPLYGRIRPLLCLVTALCTAGLLLLLRAADRHEVLFARHERRILLFAALFYLVVQLALAQALRFMPKTDAEQCFTAAQLIVDTGTFGNVERPWVYFTRYPFNLGIVYLLAGIFRFFGLFGWSDRFMQAVLAASLLFTLGLIASARLARRLGGIRAEMRLLALMASCLPLLYCSTEIYTDVFSLAFPSLILFCMLRVHDAESRRSAALWMGAFALCSFIGSQIRFTSIIAAIASLIYLLLSHRPARGALTALALCCAMLLGGAAVDAENARHIDPADQAARSLSPLHHIAMGLPVHEDEGYGQYGDGGWYIFSTSFEDPDERNAALLQQIIDRVYYLRYPNRLLNMLSRKNLSTFGDGTFQLNEIIESDAHAPDNAVKQVVFDQGALHPAYYSLCTGLFMAHMLIACLACAQALRRRDVQAAALFIALLGAFLFLCIWETRARYFFQFELMLLCAASLASPSVLKRD